VRGRTYFSLGFLTFARCTRLDRASRCGETWLFMGIPVLLDKQSGQMPLEEGELEEGGFGRVP